MKHTRYILFPLLALTLLVGASLPAKAADLIPKVENFVLFLDHSGSMGMSMAGMKGSKIASAVELLSRMNEKIPALPYQAGFATFAPYKLRNGMVAYDRAAMATAIKGVETNYEIFGRQTPLGDGLAALAPVVANLKGRTAIILISDGESNQGSEPVAQAQKIYNQAPGQICFHVISMAGNAADQATLDAIAKLNGCTVASTAVALKDEATLDTFVRNVFFDVAGDVDGDGVSDKFDKCPNTPLGTPVDKNGCPKQEAIVQEKAAAVETVVDKDTDGDGVVDRLDKCPKTKAGLAVDADGCPVKVTIELEIQFDTGKSIVKPAYDDQLQKVADFLKDNPDTVAAIEGHTDNVGGKKLNKKLSQSRADSVKKALIKRLGVETERLSSVGYGMDKPIASNKTAAGRQQNRRVNAVFSGFKKK